MNDEHKTEIAKITAELEQLQKRIEAVPERGNWGPLIDTQRDINRATVRMKRWVQGLGVKL